MKVELKRNIVHCLLVRNSMFVLYNVNVILQVGNSPQASYTIEAHLCRHCTAGTHSLSHPRHHWHGQSNCRSEERVAEPAHRGKDPVATLLHVWICKPTTYIPTNVHSYLTFQVVIFRAQILGLSDSFDMNV